MFPFCHKFPHTGQCVRTPIFAYREACVGVLSQSADRAPCSVCHREMPVTRLGMIRTHGPVTKRCPGSSNPPLQAPGSSETIANSAIKPNPPNVKILKRIPRAARDLAARRLVSKFHQLLGSTLPLLSSLPTGPEASGRSQKLGNPCNPDDKGGG